MFVTLILTPGSGRFNLLSEPPQVYGQEYIEYIELPGLQKVNTLFIKSKFTTFTPTPG